MEDARNAAELRFFGTITASVSHELKNVLAIINENAGLMEDILELAAQGRAPDPVRLLKAAHAIKAQIGRGDTIIKNLNRFAHSVDEPVAAVVVEQALALAVALAGRLAAMRGVAVTLVPPAESVMVKTAPFAFQQLMWQCLDSMMAAAAGGDGVVTVTVDPAAAGACIRLQGPAVMGPDRLTIVTDPALRDRVGATVSVDPAAGVATIMVTACQRPEG
jgi:signal transduction histidine kinase